MVQYGCAPLTGEGLTCLKAANSALEDRLNTAGADCVLPDFVNLTLEQFHSLVGLQTQCFRTEFFEGC